MNVLFFLTPKNDVAYIHDGFTIRQAMEKMEFHRYSAVPMINEQGKYTGTITEGDLLWFIKNEYHMNLKEAEKVPVKEVPRRANNKPVDIHTNIEDLIGLAVNQNFVPVVNEDGTFIGIVTRKDIIKYCYDQYLVPDKKNTEAPKKSFFRKKTLQKV